MAPVQTARADTGAATATSLTVTLGATATLNNTLVAVVASNVACDTPSGYTLSPLTDVGAQGFYVFYKTAAGTETNFVVNTTGAVSDTINAVVYEWSGTVIPDVTAKTVVSASATSASTNGTLPPYATNGDAMVIFSGQNYAAGSAPTTFAWAASTLRQSGGTSYATASHNLYLAVGDFTTTSTTLSQSDSATWTNAVGGSVCGIIVFNTAPTSSIRTGFGHSAGVSNAPVGITFAGDVSAVSLGTSFSVNQSGLYLKKIRIYWPKGSNGTVTATCGLFASSGGAATGSPLTGTSGTITLTQVAWCEYVLPSPYALTANTTYYAEVWTSGSNGGYGAKAYLFQNSALTAGPLVFNKDATGGASNGGYAYSASLTAVTGSFHSTWYGVDVEVGPAGTTTPVTASVTTSTTATLVKQAQFPTALSLATSVAQALSTRKLTSITSPLVYNLAYPRTVVQTITSSVASSVALNNAVQKITAITSPAVYTVNKAMSTSRSLTSSVLGTLTKRAGLPRTAAVTTNIPALPKVVQATKAVASPAVSTRLTQVNKATALASATSVLADVVKVKTVIAAVAVATSVSTVKTVLVSKTLSVAETLTPLKRVGKAQTFALSSTLISVKSTLLARSTSVATSVSSNLHSAQTIAVNVSSATAVFVTKSVVKTVTLSSTLAVSVISLVRHALSRKGWGIFQ